MRAGYFQGYTDVEFSALETRVTDLETNQATQAADIAALEAGIVDVYTLHAQGALAPFAVGAGAVVRVDVPALVAGDIFPADPGLWVLAGGIVNYDGSLAGVYEVHMPVSFSTSIGAATVYTWDVVEGTDLATVPVRRDVARFAVEKQLTISETTANPNGLLRLQPTGGEIGIFVFHNSGGGATLEATTLSLLLTRERSS